LFVIKKDKRRELFDKGKLLNGIRKAFEKRPVAANTIDKIADDIEAGLYKQGRQEVQSAIIGDMVMNSLKQIDQIAYIRFASVYRDFADITKLKQEVDNLARGIGRSVPAEQLPLIPENEPTVVETESRGKRK
jgi:transcriptional repressor NrdR